MVAFGLMVEARAGDRHVYLDTDGDGQLNDCPNPAHNAKGTSNTDELQVCSGGSSAGRVIGTATGRVTTANCTAGGGGLANLASGAGADVDGDGSLEPVYGHPQACVWNMAKSDSCEVHAGTYAARGAECNENCGNQSSAGFEGTIGVCDKFDCFRASVVAFGDGPNLDGTGYGTAAAPGYLRGASMNGAVDSWDPNGDKNPADGPYPAVLSGDADRDSTFDQTTCSGGVCSGDSFYGVINGCGGGSYGRHFCRATPESGSTYVRIDSDANGSLDRDVGVFNYSTRETHHLRIKDLVFTRYNGGNGAIDGTRPKTATIDLNGGDGSTDGLVVDHIWLHTNDFTLGLDNVSADRVENEGYTENHWAAFNDHTNNGCTTPTEIKNSLLVQNNARLLNFDCGVGVPCGCETSVHDNRIVIDVDPTQVPTYTDTSGGTRTRSIVVGYYKNIDLNPRQHRLWNNEIVVKSMGTSRGYFMDLQGFGNAQSGNAGQLWLYGNLIRNDPTVTLKMSRFWQGFCDIQTGGYDFLHFNNAYDMDVPLDRICSASGDRVVERNNALLRVAALNASLATTVVRSNNLASTTTADRAVWFNPGAYTSGNPGVHGGLANYRARALGPLDGTGSCDPDGDGTAGVDWDYDGTNDTSWLDLAGNLVSCPSLTAAIDIGAVQSGSSGAVCGNNQREGSEACDGTDLAGQTCQSLGFTGGTLVCATGCTFVTTGCIADTTPPAPVTGLRRTDVKP